MGDIFSTYLEIRRSLRLFVICAGVGVDRIRLRRVGFWRVVGFLCPYVRSRRADYCIAVSSRHGDARTSPQGKVIVLASLTHIWTLIISSSHSRHFSFSASSIERV